MKKLFFVVGIILLFGTGTFLGIEAYYDWGRRVVYPVGSRVSQYAGLGKSSEKMEDRIWVSPKKEGSPFFDLAWKKVKYQPADFDILDIPAQDQLMYTVGIVKGWEDIANSQDKYLLLQVTPDGMIEKYRIGFQISRMFGDGRESGTLLAIEDTSKGFDNRVNSVQKYSTPNVTDLGYDTVRSMIKNGDSVVLIPVMVPPDYARKDEAGNCLALWLTLRRVGGKI